MHNPKCLLCNVKPPRGRLEQWREFLYAGTPILVGQVYASHGQWREGEVIYTSRLLDLDESEGHAQTINSLYILGTKRKIEEGI